MTCPYIRHGEDRSNWCTLNGPDPRQWVRDNPTEAVLLLVAAGVLAQIGSVAWREGGPGRLLAYPTVDFVDDDRVVGELTGGELVFRLAATSEEPGDA